MDDQTRHEWSAATADTGTRSVRTVLLYEPSAAGTDELPQPSFGHVADGGSYATTVRRPASGGGHVTHGIATDDPAGYGPLRPAQLFGAPFWSPPRLPPPPGPPFTGDTPGTAAAGTAAAGTAAAGDTPGGPFAGAAPDAPPAGSTPGTPSAGDTPDAFFPGDPPGTSFAADALGSSFAGGALDSTFPGDALGSAFPGGALDSSFPGDALGSSFAGGALGSSFAGDAPATTLTPSLVRRCVLAQPGGCAMLLALVSALDRAGEPGAPVVVLADVEVARIVEWLVAGTLLLPRAKALALGFQVDAHDPAVEGVAVLGVHPATAARLTGGGYAVFDLAAGAFPVTTPSAHALRWVGAFLQVSQDDPQDVVDAIDLAATSGLEPDAAAALGLAAVLRREPDQRHAGAIAGWLRDGPPGLRRAYTRSIADVFVTSVTAWPLPVLEALDDAACDGLLPGRAAAVRLTLVRGETDAAALHAEVSARVPPALPAGEWTAGDNSAARRLILTALNSGQAPVGSEALLRVAARFGIDVQPSDLADRGRELVEFWADHPHAGFDPDRWPCGDRLTQALVDELTRRVRAVPVRRHDIATGWWRWLLPRIAALEAPLVEAVLGGAVLGGDDRAGLVERYLTAAAHDADRFMWTAAALWSMTDPSADELRLLKRLAPEGAVLPPRALEGLVGRLVGDAPLTHEDVEVGHLLVDAGLVPRHRLLFQLLADDRILRTVVHRLTTFTEGPTVALLHELEELPTRLVGLHAPDVVVALARSAPPRDLLAVLRRHPDIVEHYVTLLSDLLRKPGDERHAVVAYHLMHTAERRGLRPVLTAPVLRWATRASSRQLHRVGEHLAAFGPAWSASWETYLEHVRSQRRLHRLTHPFSGH